MDAFIQYIMLAALLLLVIILLVRTRNVREKGGDISAHFRALNGMMLDTLNSVSENSSDRLDIMREIVEKKLDDIQKAVDYRLDTTLRSGLDSSFRRVSEQLEEVYKSMGEMRALTSGVGDLKNILSNVSARGLWGEVQLHRLLGDFMAPGQYVENARIEGGFVEFAINLPAEGGGNTLLPIDSKFPMDRYVKVIKQSESGDAEKLKKAQRELVTAILAEARKISEKYIKPPLTTDFAIMFLPSEGLYTEAVRLGLLEKLQSMWNIMLAGPSTLCALLTSFQTGFRALAIREHSSAILGMLNAIKIDFYGFEEALNKTKNSLETAQNHLETVKRGSAKIQNKLTDMDAISGD